MATEAFYNRISGIKPVNYMSTGKMVTCCRHVLAVCILTLCFHGFSYAAEVTLQWDPNTEPDLAGYKVYYGNFSGEPYDGMDIAQGASPIVVNLTDLDDPHHPEFTATGLDDDDVYYFVLTAFDTENLESDFSNEVSTENNGSGTGLTVSASSDGGGCFITKIGF